MIWVLLQSESPWQRNDAITFFIYLCVSLFQEFFEDAHFYKWASSLFTGIVFKFHMHVHI